MNTDVLKRASTLKGTTAFSEIVSLIG